MSSDKRARENTPEIDTPESKKLRFDYDELLLNHILEETDPDLVLTVPDIDSVIKSFEDEIVVNSAQTELGYLLEASDDELGLPPTTAAEGVSELFELGENWRFEEVVDFSYVDGGGCGDFGGSGDGEYLALDGLFDYSDLSFGSTDNLWRTESMPAQ